MKDLKQIQEFFSKPLEENTFKKGDKVTYLGHPAVVTATKEYNGRNFVSVSYDKGTGKTKASDILATSGDVKAYFEESVNEGAEDIIDAYNDVLDLVKKHSRRLNDDDSYAFGLKLKSWFNKNILDEATKDEENEFHKDLDKLVHKTFGHSSDEKKKSMAQELAETIKLGEGVIEEELCPKGKAYIKKRKAAGEKSSAYLSGRAVKVCKGQMSGRKNKK